MSIVTNNFFFMLFHLIHSIGTRGSHGDAACESLSKYLIHIRYTYYVVTYIISHLHSMSWAGLAKNMLTSPDNLSKVNNKAKKF